MAACLSFALTRRASASMWCHLLPLIRWNHMLHTPDITELAVVMKDVKLCEHVSGERGFTVR